MTVLLEHPKPAIDWSEVPLVEAMPPDRDAWAEVRHELRRLAVYFFPVAVVAIVTGLIASGVVNVLGLQVLTVPPALLLVLLIGLPGLGLTRRLWPVLAGVAGLTAVEAMGLALWAWLG